MAFLVVATIAYKQLFKSKKSISKQKISDSHMVYKIRVENYILNREKDDYDFAEYFNIKHKPIVAEAKSHYTIDLKQTDCLV